MQLPLRWITARIRRVSARWQWRNADVEHGFRIERVADGRGNDLSYTIVDTMMRIDLPQALESGAGTMFAIDWSFNIIEESSIGGRGGYDHFPLI